MTKCNTDDWVTNLPWTLLGLRTTPKEGTNATAAEMTYGENIQVSGDFFASPGRTTLQDIRHEVKKHVPCQPTYRNDRQIYVPPDLHTSSHVFLRVDSHRAPLTPPYIGPFLVQQRRPKVFKVRHPRRDHVGSRHPFHIEPVDGTLLAAGYRGAKNNDIQPRS